MKLVKLLPGVETLMISVSTGFLIGCGKAPSTDGPAANAIQAEVLRKEVASLKIKLENAQSRLDSLRDQINDGGAPLTNGLMSVPEILDELIEIKLVSKNRSSVQRRLSYLFESLALQGDAAVPLIREYLNKMEDIDFAVQREGESDEERNQRYSLFRATLNF